MASHMRMNSLIDVPVMSKECCSNEVIARSPAAASENFRLRPGRLTSIFFAMSVLLPSAFTPMLPYSSFRSKIMQ